MNSPQIQNKEIIKQLLKIPLNNRSKDTFWKIHHNCLPTNEWKKRKNIIQNDVYPICKQLETISHAIFHCEHSKKLWNFIKSNWLFHIPVNIEELIWLIVQNYTTPKLSIIILAIESIQRSRYTSYYKAITIQSTYNKFRLQIKITQIT